MTANGSNLNHKPDFVDFSPTANKKTMSKSSKKSLVSYISSNIKYEALIYPPAISSNFEYDDFWVVQL